MAPLSAVASFLLDERLPVAWDGHPVKWHGWLEPITAILCNRGHLMEPQACPGCRHLWQPWTNHALLAGHRWLLAQRCAVCSLTVVREYLDDGSIRDWILDESDYGPDGSLYMVQGGLF